MMSSMTNTLKGLFQDSSEVAKQYIEGMIGRHGGFKWYENNLVPNHTSGTQDSTTPVTNGAGQSGSSLILDGFDSNATMTKGTVFTIVGVNACELETKADYGFLKTFVVTADATAVGADVTLSIEPPIYTDGPRQNVVTGPGDGAAIVFETLSGVASAVNPNHLAYHKDAFAFVTADLEMPRGVDMAARKTIDGISMRCVRDWDINSDKFPMRIDVLYGFATIRPQLACRIVG
jgi:hypothetical protein